MKLRPLSGISEISALVVTSPLRAALRVQCRRHIGDGNGLAGRADFQTDIEPQFLIHLQGEFRASIVAEPCARSFLRVPSRSQIQNRIVARSVARRHGTSGSYPGW